MAEAFSPKQLRVLRWWMPGSGDCGFDAIVCDGAVRSGKTLAMGLSFFLWAGSCFSGARFALCGRSVGAIRRNLLPEVLPRLRAMGMQITERRSENKLCVRFGGRSNSFYVFGGSDARAAGSIQGMTLAGILVDEAVLLPRGFVEQACARCSVTGSRLWFNCNPEGPEHWFYRQWIVQAQRRNALRLQFTMEDNPALTPALRQRYERLYSGVFYTRFVQGQWTAAEGRVYDFFRPEMARPVPDGAFGRWYISCDYGTVNPASFGLWGEQTGVWYRVEEFYFDSRRAGRQMTDAEYGAALRALAGGRRIEAVIVDPSAASFIELLRREGFWVQKANNDVLAGIRRTADALKRGEIVICSSCADCLREMELYVWDSGGGCDRVVKRNDHAMDDMRYFVMGVLAQVDGFAARAVTREHFET